MTAIFTGTPVVGWIERRVSAPWDTAFYRIGDGGAPLRLSCILLVSCVATWALPGAICQQLPASTGARPSTRGRRRCTHPSLGSRAAGGRTHAWPLPSRPSLVQMRRCWNAPENDKRPAELHHDPWSIRLPPTPRGEAIPVPEQATRKSRGFRGSPLGDSERVPQAVTPPFPSHDKRPRSATSDR